VTTVRLNAFGLVTDGSEMSTIASDVTAAWTSLSSSLSGSAGMAGDDELAEDWSPDYDDAAKGCAKGTEAIASFLQGFDGLLAGTGAAYKEAELTGAGKPGTSGIEIPASTTPSASVPPSALGSNPLPGGLGELAELVEGALYAVGVVFPRGDTEKLRAAALAWGTFATDLDRAKSRLGSSLVELAASEVPQSGVADEVRTAIQNMIGEFSEAASGNEAALNDLAQNIDDTWAEIRSMLESLAIELAIDIGISVALSFVTFGVGALAGAAKATTTIARWVVKIAELIRKLKIINRIPADKFLKASSVLRKLEHGPMRWRFGAEVVKGTISGAASSVIVSARNGDEITVDSLLATLAGGVVGGVAGGGVGAGFAAAFGRRAGRHAVQPTFFRATATEAAKGAAEGAAGGVAGGYTESRIKGEDFNAGLAALFGMGAGSAMGAGGHGVGAAIDARGGTGLGFDADAALAGRDGENVSPTFLAERNAASQDSGFMDRGAPDGPVGDGVSSPSSPAPAPGGGAAPAASSVAGGGAVSTSSDAPAVAAGGNAGGGTSSAGGAGPVRTDVVDVDTTSLPDTAPAGDGTSQAAPIDSTTPEPTAGSESGSPETMAPEATAPETTADASVTDSSSTSENSGTPESASPESSVSDSSPSDSTSTSESSTTPDLTATPESSATPDSAVTPDAGTTPDSSTPEGAVTETPAGEATTPEAVPSDADATSASSIDTDLVTADELGVSPESSGDASAIPTDAQLADVRSAIDADVAAHAEAAAAHASPQGDTMAPSPEATASPDASASTTPESTTDGAPVDVASSTRDDSTLGEHATPADAAASSGADGSPNSHGDSIADAPPAAVGSASAAGATLLMARPTPLVTSGVPVSDRAGNAAVDVARPSRAGGDPTAAGDASSRGGHDSDEGMAMPTGSDTGSSSGRLPHYPESLVESEARAYRQALDAELSRHGLDRRSFRRLVSKPILKLSSHEMTTLIEIRESLPDLGPGSIVQKIMPRSFIVPATADIVAYPIQTGAGGFIARFAHMTAASNGRVITPRSIFQKLGLGYRPSNGPAPFDIAETERFGIRFELDAGFRRSNLTDTMQPLRDLQDLSTNEFGTQWDSMSLAERRAGVANHESSYVTDTDQFAQAMAPQSKDPFRGNGWAGQRGHYTPEVQVAHGSRKPPLNPGAEIWRYRADGTQDVYAWFDGSSWHLA
jgi:hypothetical protein